MSDAGTPTEGETAAQRQARIRQQKREAKLKAGGQERLDAITRLSGRTPESMRDSSPAQTPMSVTTPSRIQGADSPMTTGTSTPSQSQAAGRQSSFPNVMAQTPNDTDARKLQEEYMKAMFGGAGAIPGQPQAAGDMPGEDDPMMKMMQAMMANMGGMGDGSADPNAPGMPQGGFPFNADDISKMTGIPSFLTSLFIPGPPPPPPSPEQVSRERMWKILRLAVSALLAVYTVFIVDRSITTFGQSPSAPATVQNPFLVFVMGELLLNGAKTVTGQAVASRGLKSWLQQGKDVASDGAVVIFALGCYCWWTGSR